MMMMMRERETDRDREGEGDRDREFPRNPFEQHDLMILMVICVQFTALLLLDHLLNQA